MSSSIGGYEQRTDDGRYTTKLVDGREVLYIDGDDLVPPKPNKKENAETLAGVDADGDGVRDDVELWINEEFDMEARRKALKHLVKYFSLVFQSNSDREKAYYYTVQQFEGASCFGDTFGLSYRLGTAKIRIIYKKVLNSEKRIIADAELNGILGGLTFPLNTDNACEAIGVMYEEN